MNRLAQGHTDENGSTEIQTQLCLIGKALCYIAFLKDF